MWGLGILYLWRCILVGVLVKVVLKFERLILFGLIEVEYCFVYLDKVCCVVMFRMDLVVLVGGDVVNGLLKFLYLKFFCKEFCWLKLRLILIFNLLDIGVICDVLFLVLCMYEILFCDNWFCILELNLFNGNVEVCVFRNFWWFCGRVFFEVCSYCV